MSIRINLSIEQLERAKKLLYGIPNGVKSAESNAFNRGLAAGKTEANKQIAAIRHSSRKCKQILQGDASTVFWRRRSRN